MHNCKRKYKHVYCKGSDIIMVKRDLKSFKNTDINNCIKWLSSYEIIRCCSVTLMCNCFVQSRYWLLDHQHFQILLRAKTVMWKETEMAKRPSSGSVSVMASDPFLLPSLLVISLQCYCCCWMPNRLENMLIIKEIPCNAPLYDAIVVFHLSSVDFSRGLLCLWPSFHVWRERCFERAGYDRAHRKWGQFLAFYFRNYNGRDENFTSIQFVFPILFVLLLPFRRENVCQLDPLSST